jgi:hypothetical protein
MGAVMSEPDRCRSIDLYEGLKFILDALQASSHAVFNAVSDHIEKLERDLAVANAGVIDMRAQCLKDVVRLARKSASDCADFPAIDAATALNTLAESMEQQGEEGFGIELPPKSYEIFQQLAAATERALKAEAACAELQSTFDLRWNADMRAIKRWQEATGETLVWPDHADLCVWLLSRMEAAR